MTPLASSGSSTFSTALLIDGSDIHRLSDEARTAHRAARMGFVFQSFNLVPVFEQRRMIHG